MFISNWKNIKMQPIKFQSGKSQLTKMIITSEFLKQNKSQQFNVKIKNKQQKQHASSK